MPEQQDEAKPLNPAHVAWAVDQVPPSFLRGPRNRVTMDGTEIDTLRAAAKAWLRTQNNTPTPEQQEDNG
jgi:hypothetical protein